MNERGQEIDYEVGDWVVQRSPGTTVKSVGGTITFGCNNPVRVAHLYSKGGVSFTALHGTTIRGVFPAFLFKRYRSKAHEGMLHWLDHWLTMESRVLGNFRDIEVDRMLLDSSQTGVFTLCDILWRSIFDKKDIPSMIGQIEAMMRMIPPITEKSKENIEKALARLREQGELPFAPGERLRKINRSAAPCDGTSRGNSIHKGAVLVLKSIYDAGPLVGFMGAFEGHKGVFEVNEEEFEKVED